uniref:Uncharacterized protein n=1 Tax=Caenorhabditis japonica TaxID=281687 RepID=A0A8R1DRV7_CAEJA
MNGLMDLTARPDEKTLTDLQIEKELEIALDVNDVKNSPYYKDKVLSIPITNEAGRELMQHWTDQAFSGLISAIATRRLNLAEKYNTKKHEKCAGKAMDVKSHAKCLVELENDVVTNRWLKRKKYFDQKTRKSIITASAERKLNTFKSLESYGSMDNLKKNRRRTSSELMNIEETPQDWIGSFKTRRAKRSINVKSAASYSLKSKDDMTPFAIVTKHLTDAVKVLKKKDKLSKWQEIIARIRDETSLLKKRKQVEKLQRKRMKIFQKSKKSEESREIRRMPSKRNGISGKFASMEKFIEDEELREMVHQKASNMTEEEELMMIPVDMIRKAVKIGLSLSGHNTSDFEKKTLKLISPRFMSVVPEDEEAQKEEQNKAGKNTISHSPKV